MYIKHEYTSKACFFLVLFIHHHPHLSCFCHVVACMLIPHGYSTDGGQGQIWTSRHWDKVAPSGSYSHLFDYYLHPQC